MYKAGMLPAPIIKPLRYDTIGTRIKVGPSTYIQIKSDVPGARIYFTTDGTKPGPFQTGRTGKASTHKYIGPFRLQLGNRVLKAIVVSRDRLRESPVATKYIDVEVGKNSNSDHEHFDSSSEEEKTEFQYYNQKEEALKRSQNGDMAELQGSLEGQINPINYSGTQINVWGFPGQDLGSILDRRRQETNPQLGYLTEQMLKNLNTPRAIEAPEKKLQTQEEFSNLPENLRKFCKQIQKLYERDSDFQSCLDYLIENGQVKTGEITERYDSFVVQIQCPKFIVDDPPPPPPKSQTKPKPKPFIKPRDPSPEVVIYEPEHVPAPPSPPSFHKPETIFKPTDNKKNENISQPKKIEVPPPQPPPPSKKPEVLPAPKKPVEPSVYVEEIIQQGTIVDAPNFQPEKDAEALRKSVKGLGTDEKVIIEIMGNRSSAQRIKIKDAYKLMFGRDLVDDLKGDTSGNFKKLLVALTMSAVEFDCMEIRKAIQGIGTDNSVLIEILTSRSNKRLKDVAQFYFELFKKKLEDDVQSDTSGHYRKLLTSLMNAGRPEITEVDMNLVREDVNELINAGIKKWGTDESKFNSVFGIRSYSHLRQMFDEYQRSSGKSIEDTIKSEMSGNLAKTYLALISNIRNRPAYFAKEIKKSIKGLGTDEHTLNRIIVSRCEVDTMQIKEEYQKLFKIQMEKDIADDVSGDYGLLLLSLLKNPTERSYGGYSAPEEPHQIEEVEEPKVEETPTLLPENNFNPGSDCERLRKAMKGIGTDEKTIIEIIGKRSNSQRQELKNVYKQMHGRSLLEDLHSELSGHFRDTIESLMMAPVECDARAFRKAVEGLGTDEAALIELLITRSADQINQAKAEYQKIFGRNLEADIKSDTSNHFRKVLVSLLTANRPTGNMVDLTQAKIDAQELINAGVNKWGTDEFLTILCSKSYAQLRATFEKYRETSGHSIDEGLKKEFSGDLLKAFLYIVECIKDKQAFFAQLLHKSMKGTLIRIVTTRCEVDMVQIKQKFMQLAKSSLADFIKGDTSGDFKRILLTLIAE